MRNLLIILLVAALVVSGAFLPQYLLGQEQLPELEGEYQLVSVTSEDSSDYAWKMQMLGDHYYSDREDMMSSYISGAFSEEESRGIRRQFETELAELVRKRVITTELLDAVMGSEEYELNCFYIFDTNDLTGFRIAVLTVRNNGLAVDMTMELESGKLGRIEARIPTWQKLSVRPDSVTSWYDTLRSYADYLGLSQGVAEIREEKPDSAYTEKITVDQLTAQLPGSTAWLQVRALQHGITTTLCVYQGGR